MAHAGIITSVPARHRYTFWIDDSQAAALKAIKERDGVPEAEQLRRAIAAWIRERGVENGGAAGESRRVRARVNPRSKS